MDILRQNAKAIAGAIATLIVLLLKPYVPAVVDPAFQPALEIVVAIVIIAFAVWRVPNTPKDDSPAAPPTGLDDRGPPPSLAVLLLAAALLLPLLGACATLEAQTPQQRLYALQHQYLAAITEAAAYEARPRCGSAGAPELGCSDPATVAALRRADDATDAALQTARASPTDTTLTAAAAALNGFRAALLETTR